MKRSLIALLVLAPVVGLAQWTRVPGIVDTSGPKDVWIRDAGVFSTHTLLNAYKMNDPGGVQGAPLAAGGGSQYRGTFIKPDGCLGGMLNNLGGARYIDCMTAATQVSSITSLFAFRASENLAGAMSGTFGSPRQEFAGPSQMPTQSLWFQMPGPATQCASISTASLGVADYVLCAKGNSSFSTFTIDGGTAGTVVLFFTPMPTVTASDLYPVDGGIRGAVVGLDAGALITNQGSGTVSGTFTVTPLDHVLRGVSVHSGIGHPTYGEGFGMVLVDGPGLPAVWSSIPNPNAMWQHWVPMTQLPPSPGGANVWDVLRCLNGTYCVIASSTQTTDSVATPNLMSWRNANPPWVQAPGTFTVREGQSNVALVVDAGDPDGEATYVTWNMTPATFLDDIDAGSLDGRTLVVRAPLNTALCSMPHQDIALDLVVSDALAQHDGHNPGFIRVVHTAVPQVVSGAVFFRDAGEGVAASSLAVVDSGCPPLGASVAVVAEPVAPAQPTTAAPSANGVEVLFEPPRTWCQTDAGVFTYLVRVNDGSGLQSDAGTVIFNVAPWGEPEPPFTPDLRVVVADAGMPTPIAPDATHLCVSAGASFPGVDTTWNWATSWDAVPDAGLHVFDSSGVTELVQGGVSPSVVVLTPACETGLVTFTASNTTRNGGMTGLQARVVVDAGFTLTPFAGGALTVTADAGTGGAAIDGTIALAGLNCLGARVVDAGVSLHWADGGQQLLEGPYAVSIPSAFQFLGQGACSGGSLLVKASAMEGSSVLTASAPYDAPARSAGFTTVDAGNMVVSCGSPASWPVAVTFDNTQCSTAALTWEGVDSDPLLSFPRVVGTLSQNQSSAILEGTRSDPSDFSELIGRVVTVRVTADAEYQAYSTDMTTRITVAEPLPMGAVHRTSRPVASESGLVEVEVTLHNNTTCDVRDFQWLEDLNGMRWTKGSLRVSNGSGTYADPDDGAQLLVNGLSLDAGETITIRYAGRPRLLRDPQPMGHAVLRNVEISNRSGVIRGRSTECGCSSTSGAMALLALAAASVFRRRRYKP